MTKENVSIPRITRPKFSDIFIRKRLFHLIDTRRKYPIIWIAGPPGSGKTTLAASYIDTRKLSSLWYQVDETDTDIAAFFRSMGMAVKKAVPSMRKPFPLLTPKHLQDVSLFAKRYFELLYSKLRPPFLIVFDNYQDVSECPEFHKVIIHGMDTMPEGVNIMVLSREEPPSQFARLRANHKMDLLVWDDIRFTQEEFQTIVRMDKQLPLTDETITHVYNKTQGWVAGLMLIMDDIKTKNIPIRNGTLHDKFTELTYEGIFNYFAKEVFGNADKDTQTFLLKTAFLSRMTLKTAGKLSGVRKSEKILSELSRSNFFITRHPLPQESAGHSFQQDERVHRYEPVYQYHPLFREFLLERARSCFDPEAISKIQYAAATLLAKSGMIEDAASLLLEIRDFHRLIPLIVGHAQTLLAQGRNESLEKWITSIPHELFKGIECPWLSYWLGLCRLPFHPDESRRHFEYALQLFQSKKDVIGILLSWSNAVDTVVYKGEDFSCLDRWISLLDDLLANDAEFPSLYVKMCVSSSRFICLVLMQPQHPETEKLAEYLFSHLHECKESHLRMQTEYYLSVYFLWTGNLAKAEITVDSLYRKTQREGVSSFFRHMGESVKSMHAWLTGSIPLPILIAVNALKHFGKDRVLVWYGQLIAPGICAALSCNNLKTAERLLRKFEEAHNQTRKADVCLYHYLAAWYALLQRNLSSALEHLELSIKLAAEVSMPFSEAINQILMAHVLFEQGKYVKATEQLRHAHQIGHKGKSSLIEYMYLIATAYFALNREMKERLKQSSHHVLKHKELQKERGLKSLRKAMKMGREQGYVNMFGWRPDVMVNLCATALEADIETDYVQELIGRRNLIPGAAQIECEGWPWQLKVYTLGRFGIVKNGKDVGFCGKAQKMPISMLKAIIAFGGENVSCDTISDFLWPEAEGDMACGSFRTTLHRLRDLLGNKKIIQNRNGQITIDTRYCWVDVWAFQRICGRINNINENDQYSSDDFYLSESKIQHKNGDTKELIEKAKRLYKGNFLPDDSGQPWVISLRKELSIKFDRLSRFYP